MQLSSIGYFSQIVLGISSYPSVFLSAHEKYGYSILAKELKIETERKGNSRPIHQPNTETKDKHQKTTIFAQRLGHQVRSLENCDGGLLWLDNSPYTPSVQH